MFFPTQLSCCGVNNVTDWINANFTVVPASCCNVPSTCMNATATSQYNTGCSSSVVDLVQTQLVVVAAVGIAFLAAEVSESSCSSILYSTLGHPVHCSSILYFTLGPFYLRLHTNSNLNKLPRNFLHKVY